MRIDPLSVLAWVCRQHGSTATGGWLRHADPRLALSWLNAIRAYTNALIEHNKGLSARLKLRAYLNIVLLKKRIQEQSMCRGWRKVKRGMQGALLA